MPYIEQYVNAGNTTSSDYFLISRNNIYYKLSQTDFYNEILTAVGSLAIPIDDLTDVDTSTNPAVIGDKLYWNGTNWVPEKTPIVAKSADYTATLSDNYILVDASGAARTITLPTAASATGHNYVIVKVDATANAVTIDGNGVETINGAATVNTTTQWGAMEVISNGTYWVKR